MKKFILALVLVMGLTGAVRADNCGQAVQFITVPTATIVTPFRAVTEVQVAVPVVQVQKVQRVVQVQKVQRVVQVQKVRQVVVQRQKVQRVKVQKVVQVQKVQKVKVH